MEKGLGGEEVGWRSAGYRLLSLLFRYPEKPFAGNSIAEWLVAGFPDHAGIPRAENLPALQKEHIRLFHCGLMAQESAYVARDPFTKGNLIADVAGFYRAFAVDAAEGQSGPDTLESELEFMAWLTAKEENALAAGTLENAWVCHEAEGKFLREHLGRWLPAFLVDLRAAEPNEFYRAAADLAESFLRRELQREFSRDLEEISRGVHPIKGAGDVRSRREEGDMECPMGPGPAQAGPDPGA